MCVFTRRSYTHSSLAQLLPTILSLYQVDVQTKHARNEKHFNSAKRNYKKYELERSTTGIITRAQALQTSSKTNPRGYTTAKFKTLATTHRLEMMIIFEIIQTLQTLLLDTIELARLPPQIHFSCNFSLVSLRIHPRSHRGAQRIRKGEGRWSRPPKTLTCFIRSSPADVKQDKRTNAQSLQTSSKTNAREYATAEFKTLK